MAPRIVRARRFNNSLFFLLFSSFAFFFFRILRLLYSSIRFNLIVCVFFFLSFIYFSVCLYLPSSSSALPPLSCGVYMNVYIVACARSSFVDFFFFICCCSRSSDIVSQSVLCSIIEFGSHCFLSKKCSRDAGKELRCTLDKPWQFNNLIHCLLFVLFRWGTSSSTSSLVRFGLVILFFFAFRCDPFCISIHFRFSKSLFSP